MAEQNNYAEIQKQLEEQEKINQQLQQQVAILEQIAKQFMSREAIARYGALKTAHQETAIKAIALIAQAISTGKIKQKMSDDEFREILKAIQENKQFKFKK